MAAHVSDWGDSLNQHRTGGKRLTMVMLFVGGGLCRCLTESTENIDSAGVFCSHPSPNRGIPVKHTITQQQNWLICNILTMKSLLSNNVWYVLKLTGWAVTMHGAYKPLTLSKPNLKVFGSKQFFSATLLVIKYNNLGQLGVCDYVPEQDFTHHLLIRWVGVLPLKMAGILESCKIMARYSSTIQTDNNAHTC